MAVEPIAVGEVWAYRKAPNPPVEVMVLKVVSQSGNANVRIQFEDGPNAGDIAWVSRRALKVPWARLDEFLSSEKRWRALRMAGENYSRTAHEAAALVINVVVGSEVAWDRSGGILAVGDLESLLSLVPEALPETMIRSSIEENGIHFFPWPTMVDVAKSLAQMRPVVLLDDVRNEEPVWLERDREAKGEDPWASAMVSAYDLIRAWCGEAAAEQWSEVVRLRKDNARLAALLEKTLNVLERTGDPHLGYPAKRIRGEAFRAFGPTPDWIKDL